MIYWTIQKDDCDMDWAWCNTHKTYHEAKKS